MSRTYRKRMYPDYFLTDVVRIADFDSTFMTFYRHIGWQCIQVYIDPKSKQAAKNRAISKSDAYREFKEPGPSWFRTLFTQRPYRRRSRMELVKFMRNPDYEPMIEIKPKLEYWT